MRLLHSAMVVAVLTICVAGLSNKAQSADMKVAVQSGNATSVFTQNVGQWDDSILFRAAGGGTTIWFTRTGIYYQFVHSPQSMDLAQQTGHWTDSMQTDSVECLLVKASFIGANPDAEIIGEQELEYRSNYYLGDDPSRWRSNVASYSSIVYKNVYPGVDLKYGSQNGKFLCSFILSPGADPSKIQIEYVEGAEAVRQSILGGIEVQTAWGVIRQKTVQATEMARLSSGGTPVRPILRTHTILGFETQGGQQVEEPSSTSLVLEFSSYLGGTGDDHGNGIAVDQAGASFVTGDTRSADFPTERSSFSYKALTDVFISKLYRGGVVYSTFVGGSANDYGNGIAVTRNGEAYVCGSTTSSNFPVPYALLPSYQGGQDAFVLRLSVTGELVFSTYLGGTQTDYANDITLDADNNSYVAGYTASAVFNPPPSPGCYDPSYNGSGDAFVIKLTPLGDERLFCTYLGGSGSDVANGITVDGTGIYVAGSTMSSNFPRQNAYDGVLGGTEDAFITKLSSAGSSLVYSTYFGGSNLDFGYDISVEPSGSATVVGMTLSTDFPLHDAFLWSLSSLYSGGYVTKLSPTGNSLTYSSYIGGVGDTYAYGVETDANGNAYVAGGTWAADAIYSAPLWWHNTINGNEDAYVIKVAPNGLQLRYGTFLGGSGSEYAKSIAIADASTVCVAGSTSSTNFPAIDPYQAALGGAYDVFVASLTLEDNICGDMLFHPNTDGWNFAHTKDNMWPSSWWQGFDYCETMTAPCHSSADFPYWVFPDWPLFVDAFGEDQCYMKSAKPPYPIVGINPIAETVWRWVTKVDQKAANDWHGSCYGFSVSSLLFFERLLYLEDSFPHNPQYSTLWQVPLSVESRKFINKYWVYQLGWNQQAWGERVYRMGAKATLDECKQMFSLLGQNENNKFIILCWDYNGKSTAHSVNPYKCLQDASDLNKWYLYIYDSNFPGDGSKRIIIDVAQDTWLDTDLKISPSQTMTTPQDWGIWVSNPITDFLQTPTLRPVGACWPFPDGDCYVTTQDACLNAGGTYWGDATTCGGASRGLAADQPGSPGGAFSTFSTSGSTTGYIEVFSTYADTAMHTSQFGAIGHYGSTEVKTSTIGHPITPVTEFPSDPLGYFLPNDSFLFQYSGVQDSNFQLSVLTGSTMLNFTHVTTKATAKEQFRYPGDDSSLAIYNMGSEVRLYEFESIATSVDSATVCKLSAVSLGSYDSLWYRIMPDGGLRLKNYGHTTNAHVRMEIINRETDRVFLHTSIPFAAHSTYRIVPNWKQHGDTCMIVVDSGMTGVYADTVFLKNEWSCCTALTTGDVDGSGSVDISDLTTVIDYLFAGGPLGSCVQENDVDESGSVDISDLTRLVDFLFNALALPTCP